MHLASAINLDAVEFLVNGVNPKYKIHISGYMRKDWSILKDHIRNNTVDVGFLIPTQMIMMMPYRPTVINQQLYKTLVSIIGRSLHSRGVDIPITQYAEIISSHDITVRDSYEIPFKVILKTLCMLSEMTRGGTTSVYKGIIIREDVVKSAVVIEGVRFDITCTGSLTLIEVEGMRTSFVGNYNSLLLMMDTFGQRICLEIGMKVAVLTNVEGSSSPENLEPILLTGDKILMKCGNEGYRIIEMFEAMVVAVMLEKNPDPITEHRLFLKNCINEIDGIIRDYDLHSDVSDLCYDWYNELCLCSNAELSSIFCVYRIWGHPRVDIYAGMNKVMSKGMKEKFVMPSICDLVVCQFRKMFLSSYITKHGIYPKLIFASDGGYVLSRLSSNLPVDDNHPSYNIRDYNYVTIGRIWGLPESYDVCHILNDKAVSPNISEILRSVLSGRGTVSGHNRRGIMRWIEGDSIRCKDFLKDIDDNGLDIDSLIIAMYEKERELKIDARLFSLMSEKMRMYFVLTEELIAKHILPFFPQITMKDPLHVQIKKLWSIGGPKSKGDINPNINIDFEKWNLNMREEFTFPLFKQMDEIFGFNNLISRTHSIFKNSYIYSGSGLYEPKVLGRTLVEDPPMSYKGHLGGFEGLRQKGWTVATVCLIAYIADSMKINFKLLGQGDNQVITLLMPLEYWKNLSLREESKILNAQKILINFMSNMEEYFGNVGLPIKTRESWQSCNLYMYGKLMFMFGNQLPQWCKKLLRSYALSNEGTLTVSGVIGTIFTNFSAAASASTSPDIMYVLSLIMGEWSLEYLSAYHPFTRRSIGDGSVHTFVIPGYLNGRRIASPRINLHRLWATILTVPTSVGGSICMPITAFIVRGFPDHASEGYSWMKLLGSVKSDFQQMYNSWYGFLKNPTIEYDMLIQSPWSLNHLKPPTPGVQSREVVREWLLSGQYSKNCFLRSMKEINQSFDRKRICKSLFTEKMNPLISNEIYQTYPQVYADSILRRVENTRTLKKLAFSLSIRKPIIRYLMDNEHHFLMYLMWRGYQKGEKHSDCATRHTRLSRNIGWGVQIVGLTTPHPLEFILDSVCSKGTSLCNGNDHIYARIDENGEFPPYLGSRVKTKMRSYQDINAKMEPLISTAARVARYMKWLGIGMNTKALVLNNVSAVCDVSIYDVFFEEDGNEDLFSGSVEHRFNPSSASEGCFINYSPQVGSKIFMSSDNMPKYGRGRENYTIHYQAIYCFLQYLYGMRRDSCYFHFHLNCEDCIVPVDDEIYDLESLEDHMMITSDPRQTELLRDSLGYLNVCIPMDDMMKPEPMGNIQKIEECSRSSIYYGIVMSLSLKCISSMFFSTEGYTDSLGCEDLQSFPRVYCYKLYRDDILRCFAVLSIIFHGYYLNIVPVKGGLVKLKKRVRNLLIKKSLNSFKDIGSLCMGRNDREKERTANILSFCGSYPETVDSYLRGIKGGVIDYLDEMAEISLDIPSKICISRPQETRREHLILIGALSFLNDKCWHCVESCMKEAHQTNPCYITCLDGHRSDQYSSIVLIDALHDKLFKSLESISSKYRANRVISNSTTVSVINSEDIYKNFKIINDEHPEDYSEMRAITLPTSSVYKWDDVFSKIESFSAIVIFGDGTGGTSYAAASRFPESIIYPLSYMETRRLIPQDLGSGRPHFSRDLMNINYSLLESCPDDIFHPLWGESLLKMISMIQKDDVLFVCDIELERGNIRAVETILDTLSSGVPILTKVYIDELKELFDRNNTLLVKSIIISRLANLRYKEIFLYGLLSPRSTATVRYNDILYSYQREMCKTIELSDILSRMDSICVDYQDLLKVSIHLSKVHLYQYHIMTSDTLLKSSPGIMIVSILNYINSNYKFPYESGFFINEKKLYDRTVQLMARGSKIILMSIFGEELNNYIWFKRIRISKSMKGLQHPKLKKFRAILSESEDIYESMSSTDILAARCFRNFRRICGIDKEPIISGLEDIYKYYIFPTFEK
ncbi:TPA_asm: RNA-dependent RNA polymerase [Arceuthobium sichuanense virus 2]|nr:TPA_asm: RNA-dependent RNA polymerase [Arceuthobium sichuanense virus 2]